MTKVWGPMGWMTLHSISVCYPEKPTDQDKKVVSEFMDAFSTTVTCIHCRNHFGKLFSTYKRSVPTWNASRKDLFLAICRMHNSVNKRLDKPYPKTVTECLNSLKNATAYTSPSEFRKKYIEYLFRDWNTYGRGTGHQMIAIQSANRMKKINEEYWNIREVPYSSILFTDSDDVINFQNQPVVNKPFVMHQRGNFLNALFRLKFRIK